MEGPNNEIPNAENKPEKKELPSRLKVLVVEDQEWPKISILKAIKTNFGNFLPDFRDGGDLKMVDNERDLLTIINDPDASFDIVFLDNRILARPFDDGARPSRRISRNTSFLDMEGIEKNAFAIHEDSDNFMDADKINAYPLIGALKEKKMLVVGTSSMSERELARTGDHKPDFSITKMFSDADESLAGIKGQVLDKLIEEQKEKQ
ncbi:hypothetical protein HYV44_03445 [Candidatus Microgenomates bacterium]|nr:hypothetical protein [Candidatus Microgenomates bacterium]